MKKIIVLTDYKNRFGSKHFDTPYRSGMDKLLLEKLFNIKGFDVQFVQFTEIISWETIPQDLFYIYTSSEDEGYYYKSFIEDVILFLENCGCKIIPEFKFLRANNNKVFMELLRQGTRDAELLSIKSNVFGTKEEAFRIFQDLQFPVVIKKAAGACGNDVYKADNIKEYQRIIKKISSTKNIFKSVKELGRKYLHKGYIKESSHRSKFVVQNMIPGLLNDWKVYFFMDKMYVFYRPIFKHRDFRASGGGYNNYFYGEQSRATPELFEFVLKVMCNFNVPHASLDIAFDGMNFHLIEIQFLYFGTAGIPNSKGYFTKIEDQWMFIEKIHSIEEVYVDSIIKFISSTN